MEIKPYIEIEDLEGQPIPITETKAICPHCSKPIPFNAELGGIIVKTDKNITLKTVCVNSLMRQYEDEKNLNGEEKLKRGLLAERIYKAKKTIDLTVDELKLLKDLIGKNPQYNPLFVMRAYELLDPVKKETEKKEAK